MSGDLKFNMIAGAGLATALVIMGVGMGSEALFATKKPEKPGYAVTVAEDGAGAGDATAADTLPDWGTVLGKADVAAGEATFKKCTSCHNADNGGANMTGPGLWGVVGRKTAGHEGFAYSDGMKAHAGKAPVWSYDELYQFLKAPAKYVSGTKMGFAGIKKPEDRVNLIAFLRSKSASPAAIPAPDASRAPGAKPAEAAAAPAADAAPADAKK